MFGKDETLRKAGFPVKGRSGRRGKDGRIVSDVAGPIAGEPRRVGWVAERLNAPVLKTGSRESGSWVQIPPHPLRVSS